MNFQNLIPTLKLACSCALARHAAEDLNPDAYFALGLDANDVVSVIFVNDPHAPKVPANLNSAMIIFSSGLIPLTVALAQMDLAHETAVEKMTNVILPKIPTWIFNTDSKDTRFLEVANHLSNYAANGIITAINAQTSSLTETTRLAECKHPERN